MYTDTLSVKDGCIYDAGVRSLEMRVLRAYGGQHRLLLPTQNLKPRNILE